MLHFEDFAEGQVFDLGPYPVTSEEIIAFAAEFDPQPFHLSDEAAKATILGGLCASGWHTCAMLMRMMTDAYLGRSLSRGSSGIDEVKWLKPVYAGETLSGRMTVLSKRASAKRTDVGIVKCQFEIFNAAGEKKLEETAMHFIGLRIPC